MNSFRQAVAKVRARVSEVEQSFGAGEARPRAIGIEIAHFGAPRAQLSAARQRERHEAVAAGWARPRSARLGVNGCKPRNLI